MTQEAPQTEDLAEDMNISFESALDNKQGKWDDIYSRQKICKDKSISLPTDWSSYFAEKISLVNKYCCKCFAKER